MDTLLHLTVAKLELKQMEMLDKISKKNDDYTIRIIASTITDKFVIVNGDWDYVTGIKNDCCVGGSWDDIVPSDEVYEVVKNVDDIKCGRKGSGEFTCKVISKNKETINVKWKGKYFPEINAIIFIGKVPKK